MSSSSERSNHQAVVLRNDNNKKVVAKLNENVVKINRKPVNVLDEDTFIKVSIVFKFVYFIKLYNMI